MKPIEFLKHYRDHTADFLPMCSHQNSVFPVRNDEFGDVNIGWNCGVLDENRPYFLECWATDGMTILTFFISTVGIENMLPSAIEAILIRNGLYSKKENAPETAVQIYLDGNMNKMYSINVIVGDEDDTYLDKDCIIFPFSLLNELNS